MSWGDNPWDGCPYHYTEMSPPEHYEMCRLHPNALYGVKVSDCAGCPHSRWSKEQNEGAKRYYEWVKGELRKHG